jgi:hypothetical protein
MGKKTQCGHPCDPRLAGPGAPGDQRAAARASEMERKNQDTHRRVTGVKTHLQASRRPTPQSLSPPRPDPMKRATQRRRDDEGHVRLK